MKNKPDLSRYTDAEITSEYKRRLGIKGNAARKTFGGGRPPSCVCGECVNCKRREKAKSRESNNSVTIGSGNVFADMGLSDAPERLRKAELALYINSRIRVLGLTQPKAARLLGIDRPKVSALSAGKLSLFSIETLMSYIVSLSGKHP